MKIRASLAFLAVFFALPATGQPPSENYELITTHNGLSHNIVQALLQDNNGLLWIGTYNGLCIYDGNNINQYKSIFGASQVDWQHSVDALYEDSNKNIWLGSKGGAITCFDKSKQQFIHYYTAHNTPFGKITGFCQDRESRIWVSDIKGHIGYLRNGTFKVLKVNNEPILNIASLASGSILFVARSGIYKYSLLSKQIAPFAVQENKNNITCCVAQKGHLAAITLDSTIIINTYSERIEGKFRFNSKEKNITYHQITPGNHNDVYYTDGISISHYGLNGVLKSNFDISDHIAYDRGEMINCVLEDKTGLIWMGTNSGLLKINKEKYNFKKYSRSNISGKITHNYIRSIYAGEDKAIWIGTKAGFINHLKYDSQASVYTFYKAYPFQLTKSRIYQRFTTNSILRLKDGSVIAGCDWGVFRFDKKAGAFRPFLQERLPDSLTLVWTLLEDKNGHLWIGTQTQGLYLYDCSRAELYHYKNIPESNTAAPYNSIWSIHQDASGIVWLGTEQGLYEAKGTDPRLLTFRKKDLFIRRAAVWDIKEDKHHNLWIGTTGEGMFQITAGRDSIVRHNVLPTKVISSIVPLDNGTIWISTIQGLFRYDPQSRAYTAFQESDGTISDDYNFKCAAVAHNGELFWGNKTGMISFLPEKINSTATRNTVMYITAITVGNRDYLKQYHRQKQVALDWKENFFTVGFSILDFTNPSKHKYRYKLQGFDKDWNYLKYNQSVAGYTNLPPGKFLLEIQGSADGNTWSSNRLQLQVYVRPAFWQRTFFWILTLSGIAIIVFLIVYRRVRSFVKRERQKNDFAKKIAELELRALQSQMNPHFIFNTINSIQHFILNADEIAANDYLSRFARLMRLFLESSKNKHIKLTDEITLLKLYLSLEQMRFEDKFDYVFTIPEDINLAAISIPSMLLQPFVENAIKHGIAHSHIKGIINIAFFITRNSDGNELSLICTIDDNGIGRERSSAINTAEDTEHISHGMTLINDRIRTYNFINNQEIKLNVTDKRLPETGTVVTIIIPLKH